MSREIDALVAEAMGIEFGQCPCDPESDIREIDGWQWECEICGTTGYIDRKGFATDISHDTPCQPYSTDVAAAWLVVEWLWNQRQIWLSVVRSPYYTNKVKNDCFMISELGLDEYEWYAQYKVEGVDIPLAICLAFLKAMGVDVIATSLVGSPPTL